ncbi:MAG: ABC transporter ATP-binding protein [Treponema sp.]|jgi:sn-glycerol 3-phosphate transport system ATP-binding protein|nr:ABC transporter ATP-binding protein [Treponema sp.]
MGSIVMEAVTKSFGKDTVIENLNLEIRDGSFTVLVGPSGCGKSTTLRLITGLETPNSGNIYIDGDNVVDVPPGKRDIAMVFQNYALYPTMTVEENIEFGLENKKIAREERKKRTAEICEIVGLGDFLKRKPSTLSGGQRQRVALARAMVKKPRVFLMDEPLSNLDAKLRAQMRLELIEMHKRLGTTFVYVPQDQVEARSLADDIVLMKDGVIVQHSTPRELYVNPVDIYAARFIGSPPANILEKPLSNGWKVGFRPERRLFEPPPPGTGISFEIKINTKEMLGSETIYSAASPFGTIMIKTQNDVADGAALRASVEYKNIFVFDAGSKRVDMNENLLAEIQNFFLPGEAGF